MQTNFDDLFNLAMVLTRCCGSGPEQLRQALSAVIMTRARIADTYRDTNGINHPVYGNGSLKDSCNSLMMNLDLTCEDAHRENMKSFYRSLSTACLALNGDLIDPTAGATHFHHHLDNPLWSKSQEPKALIGDYFFYGIDDMSIFRQSCN